MDVTGESAAGWENPASDADCIVWGNNDTAAGSAWDCSEPSAPAHNENPWECEPAGSRPKRTTEQSVPKADWKPSAPKLELPPAKSQELEVPDSAIPHIIGHARRTITALRKVEGISHVSTSLIRCADQNPKNLMHRVKVEGSSTAAVTRVITQIKRIVLRSAMKSIIRELSVVCLRQKDKVDDAVSVKVATAEEYQYYMSKHLKPFVIQQSPLDAEEKKYFSCGTRVSAHELTGNAKIVSRKRRRSYAEDAPNFLFGSWDSSLYTTPISSCLGKVFEDSDLSVRDGPPQMKLRIQLGKMFYFGADLAAPDNWDVSLAEMETMTSEQTLRSCFSSYCHYDAVVKARKVLQASGYEQHKLGSSQDFVCAELVDMDAPTKPSFNIRFLQSEQIATKINRKARRHAYVTFVDDVHGHDLQLRVQSRQKEPVLDEKTRRLVYEAWNKRADIEDPLISPSGHHYFPLRVLHKVFEYYRKDEFEVVLIQVSPVLEPDNHKELHAENVDLSCRWKISFRRSWLQNVDGKVEETISRATELVAEAVKFSDAISPKTG